MLVVIEGRRIHERGNPVEQKEDCDWKNPAGDKESFSALSARAKEMGRGYTRYIQNLYGTKCNSVNRTRQKYRMSNRCSIGPLAEAVLSKVIHGSGQSLRAESQGGMHHNSKE